MAFADSRIDERPFARIVSQHIGSEHEEVVIRPGEVARDLNEAVWFIDDLFGDIEIGSDFAAAPAPPKDASFETTLPDTPLSSIAPF